MQRGNLMSSTARGLTVSSSRIPQKITSLSVSKLTDSMARLDTSPTGGVQTPKRKQPLTPQQRLPSPTVKNPQNGIKPINTTTTQISRTPAKLATVNGIQKATPVTTKKSDTVKAVRKVQTPPGMAACRICGRHFNTDRIDLHQEICAKAAKKKRKVFDPMQHRLRGTEAESLIPKIKMDTKKAQPPKKTNWRRQHEEFIANIRAARQVKEHLAKGGKLSELPPPPPLDTSDYIQCPHCGRKFNEAAAERHIPKCVNIRHNKPKPAPAGANGNASKLTRNKATTRKR